MKHAVIIKLFLLQMWQEMDY